MLLDLSLALPHCLVYASTVGYQVDFIRGIPVPFRTSQNKAINCTKRRFSKWF